MIALGRLIVIGAVLLTAVYLSLWFYARAVRRDRLRAEWEAHGQGDAEAYIRRGLADYEVSLRRRLLVLVYLVPLGLMVTIVAITNG